MNTTTILDDELTESCEQVGKMVQELAKISTTPTYTIAQRLVTYYLPKRPLNNAQVAILLGITRSRVQQTVEKAMKKLTHIRTYEQLEQYNNLEAYQYHQGEHNETF